MNKFIKKSVSIVGLGYIGLPTAAIVAGLGYKVFGVDVSSTIVEKINNGCIHVQEDGLGELVKSVIEEGNFKASLEPSVADIHVIAVPTPIVADKSPDLSYVKSAVETISHVLKANDLVIIESTIPPRTCIDIVAPLIKKLTGLSDQSDYFLSHCPERVIPGNIMNEIVNNDRIIGGTSTAATESAADFYGSFVRGELLLTDATTAEMCKLMENTYRDVNIALANELASITEDLEIDINKAIELANHHPRVNIHTPGIGVGGHCIPVDPWFIINLAPNKSRLLKTARMINDGRPMIIAGKIEAAVETYNNPIIGCLGLSYKPNVDDIRESPAINIVKHIVNITNSAVLIVEPHIQQLPNEITTYTNVEKVDLQTALDRSDVIVRLVDHDEFQNIDWTYLKKKIISI